LAAAATKPYGKPEVAGSISNPLNLVSFTVGNVRVKYYEVVSGFKVAFSAPGRVRYLGAQHIDQVDVVCICLPEWAPGHCYWIPMDWFVQHGPVKQRNQVIRIAPPGHTENDTQWAAEWWDRTDVLTRALVSDTD
jgi:hypothetical protein